MDVRFRPRSYRSGTQVVMLSGKQTDANAITPSDIKILEIPSPFRKLYILRWSVVIQTLPQGGGAITAQLTKNGVGSAFLSPSVDLTVANQTAQVVKNLPLLTTISDSQKSFGERGDSLYVGVSAAGTVTVQPVGMIFTIECAVLE